MKTTYSLVYGLGVVLCGVMLSGCSMRRGDTHSGGHTPEINLEDADLVEINLDDANLQGDNLDDGEVQREEVDVSGVLLGSGDEERLDTLPEVAPEVVPEVLPEVAPEVLPFVGLSGLATQHAGQNHGFIQDNLVTTLSFDQRLSEADRDVELINQLDNGHYGGEGRQMQRTKGVVHVSITHCSFTSKDISLSWQTSMSGLVYRVPEFTSNGTLVPSYQWNDINDGDLLSFGDERLKVVLVKNTTDRLVQFGDGSMCGPISPGGFGQWFIARPRIVEPTVSWVYGAKTGTDRLNISFQDENRVRTYQPSSWTVSPLAFPLGSRLVFSGFVGGTVGKMYDGGGSTSGVGYLSGYSAWSIDTATLGVGTKTFVLNDKWGGKYSFSVVLYDRLVMSPLRLRPEQASKGYFWGFSLQSHAMVIDVAQSNASLASTQSGVRVIDPDLWNWFGENVSARTCGWRSGPCFVVEARLQRGERLDRVEVQDRFGMTGSVVLNFTMGTIKPALQKVRVRGDSMNILAEGLGRAVLEVDYENISDGIVQYYPCVWRPLLASGSALQDRSGLQKRFAQQLSNATFSAGEYYGNFVRLEDLLFSCDSLPVNQPFVSATERYRDPKTLAVRVPPSFSGSLAFAVRTPQTAGLAPLYFVQTHLGVFAKQSDKEVVLWIFDLQSGKPITGEATVQLYHFDQNVGWISSGSKVVSDWPYRAPTTGRQQLNAATVHVGNEWGFVTLGGPYNQSSIWMNDRTISLQSAISQRDVQGSSSYMSWGRTEEARVYGYTDRGLYKPGDALHTVGWYRKLTDLGSDSLTLSGILANVKVRAQFNRETIILQRTGIILDQFGGFAESFVLPKNIPVGPYIVEYDISNEDGLPLDNTVTQSQTILVEEYEKPTFFVNQTVSIGDDQIDVSLQPEYYFGAGVQGWIYSTFWSIMEKPWGWWRGKQKKPGEEPGFYYDVLMDSLATGPLTPHGALHGGGTNVPTLLSLLSGSMVPAMSATLKVSSTVTDVLTNETRSSITYADLEPRVRIGLSGNPYEWYYAQTLAQAKPITYIITGSSNNSSSNTGSSNTATSPSTGTQSYTVTYSWYYYDRRNQGLYQGVDGSMYYNGMEYSFVGSGVLLQPRGRLGLKHVTKPGNWLLVVEAVDQDGRVVGRNEQLLWYADGEGYNYGHLTNTYTLTVDIPRKEYAEGELFPINISPYISGASVLVTIEQGNSILDSYLFSLDGGPVEIPVKKTYYPTVVVGVTQIAGYDQVDAAATGSVRREPRFWQGYQEVMFDKDLFALSISIETDKPSYKPGETMRLRVTTKDAAGKLVDARLSVAIVDQALDDLYRYFKEPLAEFFFSMGSRWMNYTNLKWLYQGLKVFTQEGGKGGGGGSRNPLGFLREKFDDVAYWSGSAFTNRGVWTTDVVLPDNLTTWSIDVMGITLSAHVGNRTERIVVSQDMLIQPNFPLYVTLGDNLSFPVGVLALGDGAKKLIGQPAVLQTVVSAPDGQRLLSDRQVIQVGGRGMIPLRIDPQWSAYERIDVEIITEAGPYRDAMKHSIPLRTQGLMIDTWQSSVARTGSHTLSLLSGVVYPRLEVSMSLLPVLTLQNQLAYILDTTYQGTESTLLSLVSLILAKDLHTIDSTLFFTTIFNGDEVLLPYRVPFSFARRMMDGISTLWSYQNKDGGFSYRGSGPSSYMLSAFVYGMLIDFAQLAEGYTDGLQRLQTYLDTQGGADDVDAYLYYLSHKARVSGGAGVSMEQVRMLVEGNRNPSVARLLFGTHAAFYLGDQDQARAWLDLVSMDDFVGRMSEFGALYPLITPRMGLLAYQQMKMALYPASALDHDALLVWLMRQRGRDGLWGQSILDNFAAYRLLALSVHGGRTTPLTCRITHEGRTESVVVRPEGGWSRTYPLVDSTLRANFSWECPDSVLVESQLVGVMPQYTPEMLFSTGVEFLSWRLPDGLRPGQLGTAHAQFKISKPASHVVLEFYVPSIYALAESLYAKQNNPFALSFHVDGGWGCLPTHYEMRFDRVYLYYELLEADLSCRMRIPMIKSFDGSVVPLPSRLYQLYDDSVSARVLPTFN